MKQIDLLHSLIIISKFGHCFLPTVLVFVLGTHGESRGVVIVLVLEIYRHSLLNYSIQCRLEKEKNINRIRLKDQEMYDL